MSCNSMYLGAKYLSCLPFSRAPTINTGKYDQSLVCTSYYYCRVGGVTGWPLQTSSPHGPAKDDYSQEAAVIEEISTRIARSRLKMTKGNCGERTLDAPARRCRLSRPLNWRSLNEVEEVLPEYRTLGDSPPVPPRRLPCSTPDAKLNIPGYPYASRHASAGHRRAGPRCLPKN